MQRIDKYEILEVIGRGAMGAVYKAFHPHLKKYVAIKEILADLAHNPDIQQRFAREAELLAQLPAHPNIVMVRDALVQDGKLYLVMDFIEGGTLGDLVKQGGVRHEQGVNLLNQILSGLEAIHARGIIHRDLKASNILLGKDGTAYISDFGIAESTKSSQLNDAMATAKCVAPEMIDAALGRNAEAQQADIYAAGILAYEMLLGEARFRQALPDIYRASDPNQIAQNWLAWHTDLSRPAPNLQQLDTQLPPALASVIERMMAKDASARYRQASEARRDLAAINKGNNAMNDSSQRPAADDATVPLSSLRQTAVTPIGQPPPPPGQRGNANLPAKTKSRIPAWALMAGGGAALFLLFAAGLWAMQKTPGFTVVIKGVAPNAEVYVGEIRRGIPAIGKEANGNGLGEMRIAGLKSGELYALSVKCGSGELDLSRDGKKVEGKITGNDGEQIEMQAGKCGTAPVAATPANLTDEIDFVGKMRLVRAGGFIMGDANGKPNEQPVRTVELGYDYYIDKFEVTNKEYADFCKATSHATPPNPIWDEQYFTKYPNSPVVGVSWNDAQAYATWANKQLPTEAEWEKAASWEPKAKSAAPEFKRRWPWGNTGDKKATFSAQHTTNVGQATSGASAYGVLDMAGNVAEWTADDFKPYPGGAADGFPEGQKAVRGGSFATPTADDVRTTRRFYSPPDLGAQAVANRSFLIGFRCIIHADNAKIADKVKAK